MLRQHLKEEFRLQIAAVQKYLVPEQPVRLDGHAHYHMIPVAFDALMDVIEEEKLNVSYIRIPREYLSLYLRHKPCRQGATAINLVKVGILNLLSLRNQWKYRKKLSGLERVAVYSNSRMAARTFCRVAGDTRPVSFKNLETVAMETPAFWAI